MSYSHLLHESLISIIPQKNWKVPCAEVTVLVCRDSSFHLTFVEWEVFVQGHGRVVGLEELLKITVMKVDARGVGERIASGKATDLLVTSAIQC